MKLLLIIIYDYYYYYQICNSFTKICKEQYTAGTEVKGKDELFTKLAYFSAVPVMVHHSGVICMIDLALVLCQMPFLSHTQTSHVAGKRSTTPGKFTERTE